MKYKWGVKGLKVKHVRTSVHLSDGKIISTDSPTIRFAVDSLKDVSGKIKIVHIVINYTNGEKKTANCETMHKAISWLNLNDMQEQE